MKRWTIQTRHLILMWFCLALLSSTLFIIRSLNDTANGGILPIAPEITIDDAPIILAHHHGVSDGAHINTRDNHLYETAQDPFINHNNSPPIDKDARIQDKKAPTRVQSAVIVGKNKEVGSRETIGNNFTQADSTKGVSPLQNQIRMRKRTSFTLASSSVTHNLATKWNMSSRDQNNHQRSLETNTPITTTIAKKEERCALLFFGLPRAFQKLVLPSMLQYVIRPHAKYNCDVFVHYYNKTNDAQGRMNQGGTIDPQEILLLQQKVPETYKKFYENYNRKHRDSKFTNRKPPIVSLISDTDETFAAVEQDTIKLWTNTTNPDGKYTFFKYKGIGHIYPLTMMNIMKQWHSIESVWNLMNDTASRHHIDYSRVGMFRLDVMYLSYINIYKLNHTTFDTNNEYAVYPMFSPPMNDRMFYGPKAAVELWATRRWERAEAHARKFGGISPEMFLYQEIRPLMINDHKQKLYINPEICFVRVRADLTVHMIDCRMGAASSAGNVTGEIRRLAGGPGKRVGNLLLFNETLDKNDNRGSV